MQSGSADSDKYIPGMIKERAAAAKLAGDLTMLRCGHLRDYSGHETAKSGVVAAAIELEAAGQLED